MKMKVEVTLEVESKIRLDHDVSQEVARRLRQRPALKAEIEAVFATLGGRTKAELVQIGVAVPE